MITAEAAIFWVAGCEHVTGDGDDGEVHRSTADGRHKRSWALDGDATRRGDSSPECVIAHCAARGGVTAAAGHHAPEEERSVAVHECRGAHAGG